MKWKGKIDSKVSQIQTQMNIENYCGQKLYNYTWMVSPLMEILVNTRIMTKTDKKLGALVVVYLVTTHLVKSIGGV